MTLAPNTSNNSITYLADIVNGAGADIIRYTAPIILFFGLSGNVLSMIIFGLKPVCDKGFRFLLFCLAVCDFANLINGELYIWIVIVYRFDLRAVSDTVCTLTSFCVHFFTQISAWILVIITVQRFLNIVFPFHFKGIITLRKTIIIFILTVIMIVSFGAPHLFMTEVNEYQFCADTDETNIIYYIDMVISSILPFSLICIFNIWLLVFVTKTQSDAGSVNQNKLTYVLLTTLNVVFLVTTLPVTVYYAVGQQHGNYGTLGLFFEQIYFLNPTLNFYLYAITGKRFRQELKKMFTCKKESNSSNCISRVPVYIKAKSNEPKTEYNV